MNKLGKNREPARPTFIQVSTQIAEAPNFGDLVTPHPRRNGVEALEIFHQSNIPEPSGYNFHSQPSVQ